MMEDRPGPKPKERRPGDWNCALCGFVNFETNEHCKRCKAEFGDGGEHQMNQAKAFLDRRPEKRARTSANPLADLAREMDEEKRKIAAAEMQRPRKLLICGDVKGRFEQTFKMVAMQDKKVGPFEIVLCAGAFLPDESTFCDSNKYPDSDIEYFFIDTSPAILQAAPGGVTLGKNISFLGAYGVRMIHGFRVAYLSGYYDAAVYDSFDVDFVGGAYTRRAVCNLARMIADEKKHIDILLTSDWPANITRNLQDDSQQPPVVSDAKSWESASSPLVADLCQAVGPRYHVFSSASLFYQRPPFQTRHGDFSCRCIGLGSVGNPCSKQLKWIHALSLSPVDYMSAEELKKQSIGSLATPFIEEGALEQEVEAIKPAQNLEFSAFQERTLACLRDGDLREYLDIVKTLGQSKFSWR